jgi:hypothetical protein
MRRDLDRLKTKIASSSLRETPMVHKPKMSCYLAAAAIVALSSLAINAQTRVHFARGATRATVRGYLRGARDEANFVLRAKAGQHMRIEIKGRGATGGTVTFPSGQADGQPGGVIFDGLLPDTGDYGIRVTESMRADSWRGAFTVIIDVVSPGASTVNGDLSRYAGKYPSELFRREPALKTRLRTLLGANYNSFFVRLQTEMPIENDGGVLIARGCMAHQCTIEEAILAIDLGNDTLHVAIKSNSRYRPTLSERGAIPAALRRAMNQ